jgi:hypothetical protein
LHKKIKVDHETAESTLGFEDFDSLPVKSRNGKLWNALLANNPDFWHLKCLTWVVHLQAAFFSQESQTSDIVSKTSQDLYDNVVRVLREIRQVCKDIYSLKGWRVAVQVSICSHDCVFFF